MEKVTVYIKSKNDPVSQVHLEALVERLKELNPQSALYTELCNNPATFDSVKMVENWKALATMVDTVGVYCQYPSQRRRFAKLFGLSPQAFTRRLRAGKISIVTIVTKLLVQGENISHDLSTRAN